MDDVTMKIMYYSQKYNCQNIAVGGGVSANSLLKEKLGTFTQITEKKYTGDNAAMIAFYAYLLMR
jgi:N6-L-threonylcarbamoyladenine synthase